MNTALFGLFLVTAAFAPLAFGVVETWSLMVLEILCFTLLLFLLVDGRRSGDSLRAVPGLLPLGLLVLLAALQAFSLPGGSSISVVRKATVSEFFRLAACGAFYVSAVQLMARKEQLRGAAVFVAFFGALLAFVALMQHLLPGSIFFDWRGLPRANTAFGPYINRNHYAGLMGMIFPVVFGLYVFYRPFAGDGSIRERLRGLLTGQTVSAHFLAGLACLVIGASLVVSLSRGAMISLAAAMVFFGVLYSSKGALGRGRLSFLVLGALSVIYVGWFGWDTVIERFGRLTEIERFQADFRPILWNDTMEMIKDRPIAGAGFGSYEDLYPKYRTLPGQARLQHAHNDYLEFLSSGGLIGGALALWFIIEVFRTALGVFRKRRDHYAICLFCGSAAGVTAMLVHSFLDFNLQTGANALWFFLLLGLMVSAAHTRTRARNHTSYLPEVSSAGLSRFGSAGAAVLFVASLLFNGGVILGARENPEAGRYETGFASREWAEAVRERALKAARFDPLEGGHRYTAANAERALGNLDAAVRSVEEARRLAPTRSLYHLRLGLLYSELGRYEKAESSFREAIEYDRTAPLPRRLYGSWILSRSRKEEGLEQLRGAVVLEPEITDEYITTLVLNGLTDEEIFALFSDTPEPLLHFALYVSETGRDGMALDALRMASTLLSGEGAHGPDLYLKVSSAFQLRGLTDDALGVLRRGIDAAPEHGGMKVAAARLYEQLGNTTRAAEEYQAALLVNREDRAARQGLERVQGGPK